MRKHGNFSNQSVDQEGREYWVHLIEIEEGENPFTVDVVDSSGEQATYLGVNKFTALKDGSLLMEKINGGVAYFHPDRWICYEVRPDDQ